MDQMQIETILGFSEKREERRKKGLAFGTTMWIVIEFLFY